MIGHAALGSWPGSDFAATSRMVLGEFPARAHVPELPARGSHAGMIGRTLGMLDELGADLQPTGWRLTDNPGIDQRRAAATRRDDVEIFAEAAQEFTGEVVLTAVGPWTLAANVELPRGGKAVGDPGARRDLIDTLAAAVQHQATELTRLIPTARVLVQLDEPALTQVSDGQVRTASGLGRLRPIDQPELETRLGDVVRAAGLPVTLHSCAADFDPRLAHRVGASAAAIDLTGTRETRWDAVAEYVDGGGQLWFGAAATHPVDTVPTADQIATCVLRALRPLELDPVRWLDQLTLTPACGLAGWTLRPAIQLVRNLRSAADILSEEFGG